MLQGPPPITAKIATAHTWVGRVAREMGDSIWPGFRPDTIPVLYVVSGQGTLLLGWRGDLPAGFLPIDGLDGSGWKSSADPGAASTGTQLAAHPTAQVVVSDSLSLAELIGLTTHEAFHVFEAASKKDGRTFGQGENAFLVTTYPVFDAQTSPAWRSRAAFSRRRTKPPRKRPSGHLRISSSRFAKHGSGRWAPNSPNLNSSPN
jgi:hypothetical protein